MYGFGKLCRGGANSDLANPYIAQPVTTSVFCSAHGPSVVELSSTSIPCNGVLKTMVHTSSYVGVLLLPIVESISIQSQKALHRWLWHSLSIPLHGHWILHQTLSASLRSIAAQQCHRVPNRDAVHAGVAYCGSTVVQGGSNLTYLQANIRLFAILFLSSICNQPTRGRTIQYCGSTVIGQRVAAGTVP